MQIFEIHFNPKVKSEQIFDSFCYTSENIYEKRIGELYMVGELQNALPQNSDLLEKISQVIKEGYYSSAAKSPEKALSLSLKKANDFLAAQVKEDNVSWLGNLNLAVLSLKDFNLNFTRVGDIKIFLFRADQVIDIGKNLEFQEIEPYPLKIFSSIVLGKLAENDVILILTKEVFDFFSSQNLIQEIAKAPFIDEKELGKILKPKEKELKELSGICFLAFLRPAIAKEIKPIIFQPKIEKFSLSQLFSPLLKRIPKLRRPSFVLPFQKPKLKLRYPKFPWSPEILKRSLTSLRKKKSSITTGIITVQKWQKNERFKMGVILILLLILFLLAGFFLFGKERKENIRLAREALDNAQSKKFQAENFLIFQDEKRANALLQEAWNEVLPQTEEKAPLKKEALILKESIEESLFPLNKLEKIDNPEILFDEFPEGFQPQKVITLQENIYFFSPSSENLFKLGKEKKLILTEKKFDLANLLLPDTIAFFQKPNKITALINDQFGEPFYITPPYPDFNFDDFSSYRLNLYFFNSKSGEVFKYPYSGLFVWETPKSWLSPETKKATGAKSMTIDGSIWILTENNEIDRYHGGSYQETLKLDFFPSLKNPTKIWTSTTSPYLYLLEPTKNRIIVLTKKGEIIKQYQSDKLDNLLDFTLSQDDKTIYLLNGLKVFQIKL